MRSSTLVLALLLASLPAGAQAPAAMQGTVPSDAAVAAAAQPLPDWAIGPFSRPMTEPIVRPDPKARFVDPILQKPVAWQALHTFNPAAVVRHGRVYLLYRAEDDSGSMQIGMHTSRIGMAVSRDGLHFHTLPEPVFYPAADGQQAREWPGGVEDPRIVEAPDGRYILTYTQWNRKTYSIGIAVSRDLRHWTKYGPALGATGAYAHLLYKSGGIVTRLEHNHLVAARIQGRYWMYWGEIHIRLASSPDLIHWTPVETTSALAPQSPLQGPDHAPVLLEHRAGSFDSGFPEVGPPPILTDKGILLLYNGKNAADATRDPALDPGAYAVGEALFSASDPAQLQARLAQPVLFPQQSWERSGQYAAGTTFGEGLVLFHHHWFLYYGSADSYVGVAVAPQTR